MAQVVELKPQYWKEEREGRKEGRKETVHLKIFRYSLVFLCAPAFTFLYDTF
jgi:hypothetical protein